MRAVSYKPSQEDADRCVDKCSFMHYQYQDNGLLFHIFFVTFFVQQCILYKCSFMYCQYQDNGLLFICFLQHFPYVVQQCILYKCSFMHYQYQDNGLLFICFLQYFPYVVQQCILYKCSFMHYQYQDNGLLFPSIMFWPIHFQNLGMLSPHSPGVCSASGFQTSTNLYSAPITNIFKPIKIRVISRLEVLKIVQTAEITGYKQAYISVLVIPLCNKFIGSGFPHENTNRDFNQALFEMYKFRFICVIFKTNLKSNYENQIESSNLHDRNA